MPSSLSHGGPINIGDRVGVKGCESLDPSRFWANLERADATSMSVESDP